MTSTKKGRAKARRSGWTVKTITCPLCNRKGKWRTNSECPVITCLCGHSMIVEQADWDEIIFGKEADRDG